MMRALSLLATIAILSAAVPVAAQEAAPGETLNKKGLIEPTSKGSSGTPDASLNSSPGDSAPIDSETTPEIGGLGTNPQNTVNPYPDATSRTGVVDGGSVNGTGAMTSAHPGH